MKRKAALILAALMTALTAVSCTSSESEAPLGYTEISGDAVDYDLYVPEEWQPDISTGITAAYYSSQDPSNISVTAFELDGSVTSIEDYWNSYLPSLKATFPDLKFENSAGEASSQDGDNTEKEIAVSEPETLTIDGVPALAYNYTGSMNGITYKFYQVITFRNARVYIFTYTAELDNYDAHIEDVVGILGNFRFH